MTLEGSISALTALSLLPMGCLSMNPTIVNVLPCKKLKFHTSKVVETILLTELK